MKILDIKNWAKELGFCEAALCDASSFDAQKQQVMMQPPLSERKQLKFDPMQENADVKSLMVLLWPYAQCEEAAGREVFIDSYYAASNAAYHAAKHLEEKIRLNGRYARANVSYPAKEAAVRAGLGIIGDHSLLIHPEQGSRVIIILMETDLPVDAEKAVNRGECLHCGKCAQICPTSAISEKGMIHPERCMRNFMMEGVVVPQKYRSLMKERMLGCDLCQRVCPMQHKTKEVGGKWLLDDFLTDDPNVFSASVRRLAQEIGRNAARPQRIRAQAALLCGNIGCADDLPVLRTWADSDFEAVREHSRWAITQIENREKLTPGIPAPGLDQTT